ncbi:MAG: NAD-dependent epimerase/dehydratase family protein [Candidatus Liptonbacteria bacterium]|nr:NAD-dependent epimerase/dehydratase family protein [Candidatus Liptonbacteria bacterium]
MKIIVTGGAGFIGSHIVDAYIKAGHRVAVIDNLSTGFRKNLNPKTKFHKADINNLKEIDRIFRLEKPTIVNHHAALASVVESVKNPVSTFQTNVIGTINLLISFGKHGPASAKASAGKRGNKGKFIFASTGGAIYGNPKKIPVSENALLLPLSPYGFSKLLGEETIKFHAHEFGFDYLIFRYPNVYGPRQNPKGEAGVVAIFGGLMKSGKRPTIFGDGTKARDYVYVGDIAEANVSALKKGKNEIVNLGWGKPVSDKDIFDAVAGELGFDSEPIYAPYRKGEVYKTALLADKAKKIIAWRPTTELKEGVKNTLKFI